MRSFISTVIALIAFATPLTAQPSREDRAIPLAQRPGVAIRDLDFAAQLSPEDQRELNQWDGLALLLRRGNDTRVDARTTMELMAKQLTNMLTDALVSTENFQLFEREKLASVMDEEDLGASKRAAPGQSTARTGEIQTARYVITGAITKFGKSEKKASKTLFGIVPKIAGGIGFQSGSTDYDIGITIRVLDATTSAIITSVKADTTVSGNKKRGITGGGIVGSVLGGGRLSESATGERERLIAEAMEAVAEAAALKLIEKRERGIIAR